MTFGSLSGNTAANCSNSSLRNAFAARSLGDSTLLSGAIKREKARRALAAQVDQVQVVEEKLARRLWQLLHRVTDTSHSAMPLVSTGSVPRMDAR